MGPVQLLASLLASEPGRLARAIFEEEALAVLERLRIVRAAGALERIVCDNCDEPHQADVRRGLDGWQVRCRDHGWLRVDDADVAAIEVDLGALAESIARDLDAKGRVRQIANLWSLGRAEIRDGAVATLFVAPAVDTLSRVAAASAVVANEAQADVSVVIAGWMGALPAVFHPSVRFAALEDICTIDPSDGLEIDIAALADIVLGPVARKRGGGRPEIYGDEVLDRLVQIWVRGTPRPTPGQALKELNRRWPGQPHPSRQTVSRRLDVIEARRLTA